MSLELKITKSALKKLTPKNRVELAVRVIEGMNCQEIRDCLLKINDESASSVLFTIVTSGRRVNPV